MKYKNNLSVRSMRVRALLIPPETPSLIICRIIGKITPGFLLWIHGLILEISTLERFYSSHWPQNINRNSLRDQNLSVHYMYMSFTRVVGPEKIKHWIADCCRTLQSFSWLATFLNKTDNQHNDIYFKMFWFPWRDICSKICILKIRIH